MASVDQRMQRKWNRNSQRGVPQIPPLMGVPWMPVRTREILQLICRHGGVAPQRKQERGELIRHGLREGILVSTLVGGVYPPSVSGLSLLLSVCKFSFGHHGPRIRAYNEATLRNLKFRTVRIMRITLTGFKQWAFANGVSFRHLDQGLDFEFFLHRMSGFRLMPPRSLLVDINEDDLPLVKLKFDTQPA